MHQIWFVIDIKCHVCSGAREVTAFVLSTCTTYTVSHDIAVRSCSNCTVCLMSILLYVCFNIPWILDCASADQACVMISNSAPMCLIALPQNDRPCRRKAFMTDQTLDIQDCPQDDVLQRPFWSLQLHEWVQQILSSSYHVCCPWTASTRHSSFEASRNFKRCENNTEIQKVAALAAVSMQTWWSFSDFAQSSLLNVLYQSSVVTYI